MAKKQSPSLSTGEVRNDDRVCENNPPKNCRTVRPSSSIRPPRQWRNHPATGVLSESQGWYCSETQAKAQIKAPGMWE